MKPKLLTLWLTALMMLVSQSLFAYSFESGGIYYNITSSSDLTVEVTYKNSNYKSYSGVVTIPSSVTYSGKTYSVTSIGYYAFSGCSGIEEVNISCKDESDFVAYVSRKDISSIFHTSELSGKTHNILLAGEKQTSLTIPNSVTSIGSSAFYYCSGLTSVTIPNSVTSI